MSANETLNIGVAGACGRGGGLAASVQHVEGARLLAACDINTEKLPEAQERTGATELYTDYEEMLEKSDLDAVIVGTPMQLHVPQSIMALDCGMHVLSEVTGAVSVEQCHELVDACKRSDAIYMMGENTCYMQHNAIVSEMVKRGVFGDLYYGEGEYLHELKELTERTFWRRKWLLGIDGITYGTHSIGPLLKWMDDRVVSVCCQGSGVHYEDPRGEPYAQETNVMLARTAGGGLIRIRQDMVSDRPGCCNNFIIQGTTGVYETDRRGNYTVEAQRVWLADRCERHEWLTLDEVAEEFMPEDWRLHAETAEEAGHSGSDYFVVLDFVRAARGERPNPIDIHMAMDMTLPGLISQQSIAQDAAWLEVPDLAGVVGTTGLRSGAVAVVVL